MTVQAGITDPVIRVGIAGAEARAPASMVTLQARLGIAKA
jgi:hypothetical protein